MLINDTADLNPDLLLMELSNLPTKPTVELELRPYYSPKVWRMAIRLSTSDGEDIAVRHDATTFYDVVNETYRKFRKLAFKGVDAAHYNNALTYTSDPTSNVVEDDAN